MAKKTDSSSSTKRKKSMKKLLSASNSIAMKSKNTKKDKAKSNPFESIWSRRKFDILGKKRKGEERRIGLARSQAIEKRKKTLLKEYQQNSKSSVFIDKRIGERDDNLDEFGKAILRFQRERQSKWNKKSKYNLSDGDEEDFASILKRDDFEDELSSEDDEDANEKNSLFLKQVSSHGAGDFLESSPIEGEKEKQKTKKEVMGEIILKSKFYKVQKAKEKEEDEQLIEQLDKDFTSLAQSEALLSLTQPNKVNALKALLNKSSTKGPQESPAAAAASSKESLQQEKPDPYDRLVKEMVLDIRARPSERTKTPEEIAQEERERLEQLEEERKKRMLQADDSSDEGSDDDGDFNKSSAKKLRPVSGDDLGDSFSLDEEQPRNTGWVDEILRRKDMDNPEAEKGSDSEDSESDEDDSDDGEGSDEKENDLEEGSDEKENDLEEGSDEEENDLEEGSDEEDGKLKKISLKDWEQSDDEDISKDLEKEEEEGEQKVKDKSAAVVESRIADLPDPKKRQQSGKPTPTQPDSLPFVIEAPKSLEELQSLIENRSDIEMLEAIKRIRACNNIRLAAENRKKMQVFYGVLLQFFAVTANQRPLNFKLLNLLVKPMMEMSAETPYFAAICARHRILRIRTQFCEDIKNPEKSSWPSLKTLLLLRLWSMIFPCSDFRHAVATPAILLMCEYLMRCPIVSTRDIATGSFLCLMVLSVAKQSRKFCPEAIIFIQALLMSALETQSELHQDSRWYYFKELKVPMPWLCMHNHVHNIEPLDFLSVMNLPEDSSFLNSDAFRASVLVSLIEMLKGFASIYEGLHSFPEIFAPFSVLLNKLAEQEKMPDLLQGIMTGFAQLIEKKVDEHHVQRRPLQMQKQRIVPIKLSNPKFEENFVKGRDYDPDRERAEMKKLKRHIKREAKGAARELRKDNYFLLEAKERDRKLLEEERAEKYGKAMAFLQEQEHAYKSGQLGKGRKRRR